MYCQSILDRITAGSREILGENLVGVYLHGSLAMGCFQPRKSDIDLLVVVEGPIPQEQKLDFMELVASLNQEAPEKGIEMSVVRREHCLHFVYPTPFDLHFSPAHLDRFRRDPRGYLRDMQGTDPDLAAHFTITRRYGIPLWGEPLEKVFGPVPKADYLDSIWQDVAGAADEVAENPVYVILNLCRVAAYLEEDAVLSKKQGGEWGMRALPAAWHPLIARALHSYATGEPMEPDIAAAQAFCSEMLGRIQARMD